MALIPVVIATLLQFECYLTFEDLDLQELISPFLLEVFICSQN